MVAFYNKADQELYKKYKFLPQEQYRLGLNLPTTPDPVVNQGIVNTDAFNNSDNGGNGIPNSSGGPGPNTPITGGFDGGYGVNPITGDLPGGGNIVDEFGIDGDVYAGTNIGGNNLDEFGIDGEVYSEKAFKAEKNKKNFISNMISGAKQVGSKLPGWATSAAKRLGLSSLIGPVGIALGFLKGGKNYQQYDPRGTFKDGVYSIDGVNYTNSSMVNDSYDPETGLNRFDRAIPGSFKSYRTLAAYLNRKKDSNNTNGTSTNTDPSITSDMIDEFTEEDGPGYTGPPTTDYTPNVEVTGPDYGPHQGNNEGNNQGNNSGDHDGGASADAQDNDAAGAGGYARGGRAGYFFGGRVNYKKGGRINFRGGGADMGATDRAQEREDRGYGSTAPADDRSSQQQTDNNDRVTGRGGNDTTKVFNGPKNKTNVVYENTLLGNLPTGLTKNLNYGRLTAILDLQKALREEELDGKMQFDSSIGPVNTSMSYDTITGPEFNASYSNNNLNANYNTKTGLNANYNKDIGPGTFTAGGTYNPDGTYNAEAKYGISFAQGGRARYAEGGAIYPRLGTLSSGVQSAEQQLQSINASLQKAETDLGSDSPGGGSSLAGGPSFTSNFEDANNQGLGSGLLFGGGSGGSIQNTMAPQEPGQTEPGPVSSYNSDTNTISQITQPGASPLLQSGQPNPYGTQLTLNPGVKPEPGKPYNPGRPMNPGPSKPQTLPDGTPYDPGFPAPNPLGGLGFNPQQGSVPLLQSGQPNPYGTQLTPNPGVKPDPGSFGKPPRQGTPYNPGRPPVPLLQSGQQGTQQTPFGQPTQQGTLYNPGRPIGGGPSPYEGPMKTMDQFGANIMIKEPGGLEAAYKNYTQKYQDYNNNNQTQPRPNVGRPLGGGNTPFDPRFAGNVGDPRMGAQQLDGNQAQMMMRGVFKNGGLASIL